MTHDRWYLSLLTLLAVIVTVGTVFTVRNQNHINHNQDRIKHDAMENCRAIAAVAAIENQSIRQSAEQTKLIIGRVHLPGISHAQILALTRESAEREEHRGRVLDLIALRACRSL
jgi:hypothetical protein